MESQENQDESQPTEKDQDPVMSNRKCQSIKTQNTSTSQPTIIFPPSPPSFVTMGQLTEAANAFYNMSLAHEITVDSDFKIEKYEPPEESLENRIKKTMHRAFWDLLRSSLESDPPDYEPTLRLLEEVKQSLIGLVLPHQKTLKRLVDQSLDMEIVRAQLNETGSISLEVYAERVISLMKQFCAPVRDAEVEELRHISDPVDAFQHAFALLEKMHMDLANFTIAQMRPYIRDQAVTYERTQFATFLETQRAIGIDGLARTREWILEAYRQLVSPESSTVTEERPEPVIQTSMVPIRSLSSSSLKSKTQLGSFTATEEAVSAKAVKTASVPIPPTPNNIIREAYLALLTWPAMKDWPETMVMDQQRLTDLGRQLTSIVTLSSLVLVVCNYMATNIRRIFLDSARLRTDPDIMLELKRSVCRTALTAMSDASDAKSPSDPEMNTANQIVLTVEHWCNRIMNQRATATQEASVSAFIQVGPAPYVLPATIGEALKQQIHEVFQATHPVYILMHKRAIEFLRTALSSHPPEPLPLPSGFSVLLDVTGEPRESNHSTRADATPAGPSVMATGGHTRPVQRRKLSGEISTETKQPTFNLTNLSLSNVASRLLPLLAHNRHVFGPRYAEIIQKILMSPTSLQNNETPDQDTTFEMNP